MSILSYNGSAMVAMKGKNCVAIATDKRFGIQAQTISMDFPKVFQMGPHLFIGLPGLATDTQTVMEKLRFRKNLIEYAVRKTFRPENRHITPTVFASLVSNMLYEKRFGPFFVEPVIAGLDSKSGDPFVCNMDLIGCPNAPEDFVVGGTASAQLYGMCESLWEPDLSPDDLFETISQALINAFDRDAISGWGATVYIIEKDKITTKALKTRI
ncbi:Proteasome subunit [Popillia japonica]|uniref:Proteasome subunit beta n=1 Tax=Popillia japonica TaxID=7064 RepID=A0AAW1MGL6_POPJA